MMRNKRTMRIFFAVIFFTIFAVPTACVGSGGNGLPEPDIVAEKIEITGKPVGDIMVESGTLTLSYAVYPANADVSAVHWSSSDTSIAAVDESGNITAVSPGTAIITVDVVGLNGVSASFRLTVTAAIGGIPATGIAISGEDAYRMTSGGPVFALSAQVVPENSTDSLDWYWTSSNPFVADVDMDTGIVTPKGVGFAVITVQSDSPSFSDNVSISVIPVSGTDGSISADFSSLRVNTRPGPGFTGAVESDILLFRTTTSAVAAGIDTSGAVTVSGNTASRDRIFFDFAFPGILEPLAAYSASITLELVSLAAGAEDIAFSLYYWSGDTPMWKPGEAAVEDRLTEKYEDFTFDRIGSIVTVTAESENSFSGIAFGTKGGVTVPRNAEAEYTVHITAISFKPL